MATDLSSPLKVGEPIHNIIHVASLADSQFYKTNPVDVALPNVLGMYHCLELARKKAEHFLYFQLLKSMEHYSIQISLLNQQ